MTSSETRADMMLKPETRVVKQLAEWTASGWGILYSSHIWEILPVRSASFPAADVVPEAADSITHQASGHAALCGSEPRCSNNGNQTDRKILGRFFFQTSVSLVFIY